MSIPRRRTHGLRVPSPADAPTGAPAGARAPGPRRTQVRRARAAGVVVGLGLVLAACGSGADDEAGPSGPPEETTAAEAGSALDLAEVCPATVVVQEDWQPEAEHGGVYHLVGSDYTIDAENKSVTASLVAGGVDTGVDIEVRPGGPNVGFQSVAALMYVDPEITLGAVNTDSAIINHSDQPTVAIVSQMTVSPQILMWDPETYPEAETIEDIVATGATIVTGGTVLHALLAETAGFDMANADSSYEGTPARFVADPSIVQQGLATNEPYVYEHEVEQWDRPVGYALLADVGYSPYPGAMAVRADRVDELSDCLERLVPVLQQSQIDFLDEPGPTLDLIVELVDAYQLSWTYSPEVAQYSVDTQLDLDLVHDDPASGTFGAFDPARMQEISETFVPILSAEGAIDLDELDPTELYTNEFVDPDISMER